MLDRDVWRGGIMDWIIVLLVFIGINWLAWYLIDKGKI